MRKQCEYLTSSVCFFSVVSLCGKKFFLVHLCQVRALEKVQCYPPHAHFSFIPYSLKLRAHYNNKILMLSIFVC